MGQLSDGARAKVLGLNCARFLGIEVPARYRTNYGPHDQAHAARHGGDRRGRRDPYYRHGQAPVSEFVLCLQAILAACEDAGIDPRRIDGFASYSNDRNDPPTPGDRAGLPRAALLQHAVGRRRRRRRGRDGQRGRGGGDRAGRLRRGLPGAGAGPVRPLRRGAAGRAPSTGDLALTVPYGQMSPAQWYAPKVTRFMHEHGDRPGGAQRAIALASYHHAQANPRAVMYGRPLTAKGYDASRWITEPFHLYDCCQENDGAAALILVPAERATPSSRRRPTCWARRWARATAVHSTTTRRSTPPRSFKTLAPRLYEMAGVGPADVDVVQCYENFTGGVLMALVEHGFFAADEAMDFLTLENLIAPTGKLPLNTSGGNLAECYMHGLELQIEATRQLRGQSTAQVPDAEVAGDRRPDGDAGLEHDPGLGGDAVMRPICRPDCRSRSRRTTASTSPTGTPRGVASCWSSAARLRHLPVGAGMDLPQVPVVRDRLAQGVGEGPYLQLGAAVASGASGLEGAWPLHRRAGRTAGRRQCAHDGQPPGRSEAGRANRRRRRGGIRTTRRRQAALHSRAVAIGLGSGPSRQTHRSGT